MSVRLLLLTCAAALALAGCGVKGPLEHPKDAGAPTAQATPAPMTNAEAAREAGDQAWGANPVYTGGLNPPDMPGNSVSTPAPATTTPATKKSFFLDFLL
ncbi:LPS translocon maturation chaperone LptM [Aquabacter cavernae]|uniref:LPS translocon maturation chaperone LptM n=1 Tax=Aquabacter cavernae TaxID=2496029 RepID=UPI000F8CBC01|nr:lipoprotein [Aquabacter cavernae]